MYVIDDARPQGNSCSLHRAVKASPADPGPFFFPLVFDVYSRVILALTSYSGWDDKLSVRVIECRLGVASCLPDHLCSYCCIPCQLYYCLYCTTVLLVLRLGILVGQDKIGLSVFCCMYCEMMGPKGKTS